MDTEKLYEKDPYLKTFSATVTSCRPEKQLWLVTLDRTAFFPEGGGQPYDIGTLDEIPVQQVHLKNGELLHYTCQPLAVGTQVTGRIDWVRRFDLMQQHSGEHIISGLIHQKYGYDNVGFHLGLENMTIDLSGELDMDQLAEIEAAANAYIWENHPTEISCPPPEELSTLPYRSKKELTGVVRIVRFPGADLCACCGTHVAYTGEIGLVKLLSCQRFREGVRIELLCGKRAVAYCSTILAQNHQTSVLLSAKVRETAAAVRRLYEEHQQQIYRLTELENQQFVRQAQALAGKGDVLLFEDGLSPDGVRRLAIAVLEQCGGLCAVFSGDDANGYKYALGQKGGDLRVLVQQLNSSLNGRGGGKPFFAQGSVQAARAAIEAFFQNKKALC
ncbi:MAG: alanyl-tRNA editing protein [Anaerotruncus sp.]|nr:alanyl-tRNA editing protein [Anaerotruncus sp.]